MKTLARIFFLVFLFQFVFHHDLFLTGHAADGQDDDSLQKVAKRLRVDQSCVAERQPSLLQRTSSHHYAVATADTAFKLMLSLALGSDKNIVISFLNSFIPAFRGDPITDAREAPVAIPALRRPGEKQTFMDLHVISSSGVHYLIEMQAQRHIMFDERSLFYACSTYSRQLSEKELSVEDWYTKLKAVIALQILDYDTNRVKGIKSEVPDLLVQRTREHPLQTGEFIKHYLMTDQVSGQVIDYLQMVQVELPRAEANKSLFPPIETFTTVDWWLSLLRHANDYTDDVIESFYSKRMMPENIYKALRRLDLTTWDPRVMKEYQEDLTRRDLYGTVLAVERAEGEAEALERVARNLLRNGMNVDAVAQNTGLSEEQIKKLIA